MYVSSKIMLFERMRNAVAYVFNFVDILRIQAGLVSFTLNFRVYDK